MRIYPGGEGTVVVNDKPATEYFGREWDIKVLSEPLAVTSTVGRFNVTVHVSGGGITGQSGAIGWAWRARWRKPTLTIGQLCASLGMLSRDPRAKERKKPELKPVARHRSTRSVDLARGTFPWRCGVVFSSADGSSQSMDCPCMAAECVDDAKR